MALALKIIGWWMLLSWTLGPCLTWLFSTASVKENTNKIVDDLSIACHRDRLRNLIEIRPYVSGGRSLCVNRRGPLEVPHRKGL